ncbi:hypothetical protein T07_9660 [Trichinella nelsoni]|uniref:Uncharacterized protein n=1 Tax=Trichinella nelsoni TaxID=6336 RepID=A0A0V0RJA0_9BILA|nr:hypothetical protein T07_9660 [Trichinella nelsoni]
MSHIRRVEVDNFEKRKPLLPPCQLQTYSTNYYNGKFPRNGNKKYTKKRASCKIAANVNSIMRKFRLRHQFIASSFPGLKRQMVQIRFGQKQKNIHDGL